MQPYGQQPGYPPNRTPGAPPPGAPPRGAPPGGAYPAYGAPPGSAPPAQNNYAPPPSYGGAPPQNNPSGYGAPPGSNAMPPRYGGPPGAGGPPSGAPPASAPPGGNSFGAPAPPQMGYPPNANNNAPRAPNAPPMNNAPRPPMAPPMSTPNPGATFKAPPGGNNQAPQTLGHQGHHSPHMATAPAQTLSAPPRAAPPSMGAPPPSMMGGPPKGAAPPSMGGPPSNGGGPPGSGGAKMPPPASNVMFYSTGSGSGAPAPNPTPAPPRGPPGSVEGVTGQLNNMNMAGVPPGMASPSASFDSQVQPHAGGPGSQGPGQQGPGGGPGSAPGNSGGAAVEIDDEANCDAKFMRFTMGKLPNSDSMAQTLKCPMGLIVTPMALDKQLDQDQCPVDVVNFGKTGIVRCKRCRTYVNPFVNWVNNGRQWRCNICGYVNEVPHDYFSHLDADGQRRDKESRPELAKGSVELVAPSEYMLRPPQAPVYMFVIDVSQASIANGMLAVTTKAIKDCLDELPGQPRTQVGFLAFDSAIHFFNIKSNLSQPQMLTVPDLNDMFLPLPDELLVNLSESRTVIDSLLDALPTMFANTRKSEVSLGPALNCAFRIMSHIGGKMLVFLSSLPNCGEGALKHREDPRKLGAGDEHHQLNPAEEWYKAKATEFHRLQICVDLFLFSNQYTDVATLKELPKFTAGDLHYYPGFHAARDGVKYASQLTRVLTRSTGFEAVMRVRATRGLRITHFHGNFSIRGTDLLALPNCHPDSSFALELVHDDALLSSTVVSIQAALLYTTSGGERRIRVHTLAIPVSGIMEEVVSSVDIDALCNILARQALDTSLKTGFEPARLRLQTACVDILRGSRPKSVGMPRHPSGAGGPGMYNNQQQQQQQSGEQTYPDSLQLLPLYTMALQKSVVFRGGSDLRPDERSNFMNQLNVMGVEASRYFIYPRMFALHNLPPDACEFVDSSENAVGPEDGLVSLPPMQNLSAERLCSDGVFMLENSLDAFIWVGQAAPTNVLYDLFGLRSIDEGGDFTQVTVKTEGSVLADKLYRLLQAFIHDRGTMPKIIVVREGDPNSEANFFRYLVEDRASFQGGSYSYGEYMALIGRQTR